MELLFLKKDITSSTTFVKQIPNTMSANEESQAVPAVATDEVPKKVAYYIEGDKGGGR